MQLSVAESIRVPAARLFRVQSDRRAEVANTQVPHVCKSCSQLHIHTKLSSFKYINNHYKIKLDEE